MRSDIPLLGVSPVGVNLETVDVAYDEEGRIPQRFAVVVYLFVGGGEVLALALVLPGELAL